MVTSSNVCCFSFAAGHTQASIVLPYLRGCLVYKYIAMHSELQENCVPKEIHHMIDCLLYTHYKSDYMTMSTIEFLVNRM